MEKLIKALNIFLKYGNPKYPTHCEHDKLFISINPIDVDEDDTEALAELGFFPDDEIELFYSFEFGRA